MAEQDRRKKQVPQPMGFVEFSQRYATEEVCRERLFGIRAAAGFVCPKCGCEEYYHIKTRHAFQCKKCRHQMSLTAGTVMDSTHMPLRKWFWAIYLVTTDKRGISAKELERQLHVKYHTAWFVLQRIRVAMGNREEKYMLDGVTEFDDSYFGGQKPDGKAGRGCGKTKVLTAVSKDPSGRPKFLKLRVVPNLRGKTIGAFAEKNIAHGSTIQSDAYRSYRKPLAAHWTHAFEPFDPTGENLVWLHTILSNVKAFIQGTYHGIAEKHLQRYLDEYEYRFNRRFMLDSIFDHLLVASTQTPPCRFASLVAGKKG